MMRRADSSLCMQKRLDAGEHAPEERANEAVARERPRRDASVHDERLHARAAALAQQVRPDLAFHHARTGAGARRRATRRTIDPKSIGK